MQHNKIKLYVDICLGSIFMILFLWMSIYGFIIIFKHHVIYELTMGIFISIIGVLGTYEGFFMFKKSIAVIKLGRQV